MRYKRKQIIIVGDRVLIQPDTGEKKSAAGLYLPPSVIEKQDVHGGIVPGGVAKRRGDPEFRLIAALCAQ